MKLRSMITLDNPTESNIVFPETDESDYNELHAQKIEEVEEEDLDRVIQSRVNQGSLVSRHSNEQRT